MFIIFWQKFPALIWVGKVPSKSMDFLNSSMCLFILLAVKSPTCACFFGGGGEVRLPNGHQMSIDILDYFSSAHLFSRSTIQQVDWQVCDFSRGNSSIMVH